MPTIDALGAAAAVADTDEIPLSQNGVAAKATRAQIVAGLQPALALGGGQLLGRSTAGSGAPEAVSIGTNLSLSGGVLSGTAPLVVSSLPAGIAPGVADLVVMGQAGGSVAVPYGAFMGGLAGLSGIDLSAGQSRATGGGVARPLAAIFGDALAVEAFGAKGDGVTDDTAALTAAVASGRPVLLGARTYIVSGQWTIASAGVTLLGVPGQSVLRRAMQSGGGAWISVQADQFRAMGVTFDANGASVGGDDWGVLVTPLCLTSEFYLCVFKGAVGATLGSGLVFGASYPSACDHVVQDCEFSGNALHGLWVQACSGVRIGGCRAFGNGQFGINADFNDARFEQKVSNVLISGNRCWGNLRGIGVGNYNATNTQPAVWGNANPDAIGVVVSGNVCHDNTLYGIAVSGQNLTVSGNLLRDNGVGSGGGAGILANVSYSRLCGNMVSGASVFGIDAGGSLAASLSGNDVSGAAIGINCGGGTSVLVEANTLQGCTEWGVTADNVETDGLGNNFNAAANALAITGNWIGMPAGGNGVLLRDAPQNVLVANNHFTGPGAVGTCLYGNTDTLIVGGNRFNFTARFVCNPQGVAGQQQIVFPDIADAIMVTAAPSGIQSMISACQAQSIGQISFVKITSGGSGYSRAMLTIGGVGNGATATAMISNGVVIGAVVVSPGSGYGPIGSTAPVVVSGDGTGCAATAYAAPPLAEERRMLVRCNVSVHFTRVGSAPLQENWTLSDIDVPANSEVMWTATWGEWRAGPFEAADYLGSDGLGGAILRSQLGGDVVLHPNAAGHIRRLNDTEETGCVSSIGRGSPEGVLAAPAGSDYRNLDGGAGATYWIKQSGTSAAGWIAVA